MGRADLVRHNKMECPMSALGQKRTLNRLHLMSALPPKADITECDRHVRFVPKADIHAHSISWSVRASSCDGTVTSSALAALRLTIKVNLLSHRL